MTPEILAEIIELNEFYQNFEFVTKTELLRRKQAEVSVCEDSKGVNP